MADDATIDSMKLSDNSSVTSSDLFGIGKISPRFGACSISSLEMFGSGYKKPEKECSSFHSDKSDKNYSVSPSEMFGSGIHQQTGTGSASDTVPISDVEPLTYQKQQENPSPAGSAPVQHGTVVSDNTSIASHAVQAGPDANVYPPMVWTKPRPYYPYYPYSSPYQTASPRFPESKYPQTRQFPPNFYYPSDHYQMQQYQPAPVPHTGGPARYFVPYMNYPPQGYPIPPNQYIPSYPTQPGGYAPEEIANAGRNDRPPMPLPRHHEPLRSTQLPQSHHPPTSGTSVTIGNLHTDTTRAAVDTGDKSADDTAGVGVTTGDVRILVSPRVDKLDTNWHADVHGKSSSSQVEMCESTLNSDRYGYMKANPAPPATVASQPDSEKTYEANIPVSLKIADANVVKDGTMYAKISDIDVDSQRRFPDQETSSSWKPKLPTPRPVTDAINFSRPSRGSPISRQNRRTEPAMLRQADIVLKSEENTSGGKVSKEGDLDKKIGKSETETCKIKVHGFNEETSKETLELFFENKRSSGGNEIVRMEFSHDSGEAIIEFQSTAVVERVMSMQERSPLCLNGCQLKVKPYIPPPVDKYKLLVSCIAETTTQESLEYYLEARCGIEACNIVYGHTPGTALITFTSQPDVDKVRFECKRRTLENSILSVSTVCESRCVKVNGFAAQTTTESLLYYFENVRRSGGGPVETVDMDTIDDACLVYFQREEDANRVCENRRHTLDNCQLSVQLHYKCLEPDPSLILKIPPPVRFDELNSYLVRFLKACKPLRKNLEDVLTCSHAKIIWPETKEDSLEIICTLEQGHKDGRRIVEEWQQTCRDNLGACTRKLVTNDQLHAAQEVWSGMKDRLIEIAVEDPESVALFVNQDDHSIVIVGKQDAVNKLSRQVTAIITDLEQTLANEKQNITKSKTIRVYQMQLLYVCKFVEDMPKKGCDATIDQQKREITFKGMKKDVDDAMMKMHKFLQSFERSTLSLPKLAKDLLFVKQTRDYIRSQMKKARVIGVWDVVHGQDLIMYSRNEKDVQTAINIVKRCLPYKTIPLDLNMEELLTGESGKSHIESMCTKYNGLLKIEQKTGELFIVTIEYLLNEITEECMKFFDLHAVISEFIHVDVGKLRFIHSHYMRDLRQIEEQYRRLAVKLNEVDKTTRQGFKIEGKKDGCKLAITQVQTLVNKILCRDYIVKTSSAKEFFCSSEGMDELRNLEMAEKCVLLVDSPAMRQGTSSSASLTPHERAAYVSKGCKIVVMEGDITEMKVDAIVNPSKRSLQQTHGLAAAIIDKGGYNIQKECEAYVTKKGPLADAEFFVSGPGLLQCQHIIHAVIPTWRNGTYNEERLLKTAVKHCIEEAERRGCTTIAFPAVGARIFRFPLEKVAQVVVETVVNHIQLPTSDSTLKGVFLCDIRASTIKQFISTMKSKLGHHKVHEMAAPGNQAMYSGNDSSTDSSGGSYEEALGSHHGSTGDVSLSGDTGIRVTVVKGELAKQNVDVLVNSTNQKLDLRIGATSKSLVVVGGQALLQDCATNYPEGIRVGQVAMTTGGKLQCHQVYHGMLDKWDRGQGHAEKVMRTFVDRCLALADEQKLTSLAFPALGTGVLGFPADIVAKLMFTCIHDYHDANPTTGIRKVLLIVFPGDTATVKAFQMIEHVQYRQQSRKRSVSPAAVHARRRNSLSEDMVLPASRGHTFSIGQLTVEVSQGDITKETTAAIVNSTLAELDLQKGAVSKAILMAAGQSIQTECQTPENRARMLRDEFVVTGSGRLLCHKIIHLKAKSRPAGWQKNVARCLEEAEYLGLNSVAFPALGTGGKGCSPDSVAKAMFSAFRQFADSKEYHGILKKIKIVIFQAEMVDTFVTAATGSPPKSWKFFKRNKSDIHEGDKKLTILIYTDSQYKVDAIRRILDGMFVKDEIYKQKAFLEELQQRQVDKMRHMGQTCGVQVQMGSRAITLEGYSHKVAQVKDKILAYFNNIDRDATKAATKAASVTLPPNWTKMSLKDATQVIKLLPTDADYVMVSQKFVAEIGLTLANIVTIERIQNPTLYTQYIGKKSHMEFSNSGRPVERPLWHGTAGTTVDTINQSGFNRNYNQGSSHGVGVYFGVKAATSHGYSQPDATGNKHMYLANVLTGDFCQGQGGIRHPPCKNAANPNVTYDSTTDNVNAPNFFVIFHDAQAYPCFHVTFK